MRDHGKEHGGAMIIVTAWVALLAGLSLAYLTVVYDAYRGVQTADQRQKAFRAAESGLDLALAELRSGTDLTDDGVGVVSASIRDANFQVTIEPTFTGPGTYVFSAVGAYGSARRGIQAVVSTRIGFEYGLFTQEALDLVAGISTDSYDARLGSYQSQAINVDSVTGQTIAGDSGHVGSNGEVTISGYVHGAGRAGPTGVTTVYDPGEVTGSTAPLATTRDLDIPAYAPTVSSTGPFVMSSGTQTLTGGVYHYDRFEMAANTALTISGDVTMYVDADFDAHGTITVSSGSRLVIHHASGDVHVSGGGFVNVDQMPGSLLIYSTTTGEVVFGEHQPDPEPETPIDADPIETIDPIGTTGGSGDEVLLGGVPTSGSKNFSSTTDFSTNSMSTPDAIIVPDDTDGGGIGPIIDPAPGDDDPGVDLFPSGESMAIHGVIQCPWAVVTTEGHVEFFGAVSCRRADLGPDGGAFHFDTSLSLSTGAVGDYEVSLVREFRPTPDVAAAVGGG